MSGQIIKRGEDTYYIRVFLGKDNTGKRRYFNKTFRGKKKDAEKFLTSKLRERDLGTLIEPSKIKVGEYLDTWLNDVQKPQLKENTFASYNSIKEIYLKKHLGDIKLHELKALQIQAFYSTMQLAGLSPRTIRYAHTILSSALKNAVKMNLVSNDQSSLCSLPRKISKEKRTLTHTEAKAFLEAAKSTKWYSLFRFIFETGLRPSEYLGLKWNDIDFDSNSLSVVRTVVERAKGGFFFGDTKTNSSRRSLPLSTELMQVLKSHRIKQFEERLKLGQDYQNHDLVFASETGTPLQRRNLIRRHFKPLLKKAGLPDISIYEMRHTTATLLFWADVHPKIVSERLGHSSVVLTLDTYSHVLPTMQKEATAKLFNIFKTA